MEPIFFVPFFVETPWGGKQLAERYQKYPAQIRIGESWELSPVLYRQTFVKHGEYAGIMLSDLYKKHRELFGTESNYFPFVIKFVDVGERQPLLVHGGGLKSDATQSEGLVIIDAEPDSGPSVVGTKIKDSIELFSALADESGKEIEDSLIYMQLHKGDSIFVPPGCLHAIAGGTLLYTVTSPLVETTSLYDWKKYNGWNIEKAVGKFLFDFSAEKTEHMQTDFSTRLVLDSELYRLELIETVTGFDTSQGGMFSAFTSLAPGYIEYAGGKEEPQKMRFRAGETFLMPAGFGDFRITGGLVLRLSPKH
jgi:mannose-6-phosphate isomerase class I